MMNYELALQLVLQLMDYELAVELVLQLIVCAAVDGLRVGSTVGAEID